MKFIVPLFSFILLAACSTALLPETAQGKSQDNIEYPRDDHGEVMPFMTEKNASKAVDDAIINAAAQNKKALIVMGANWCHDSRALATHFEMPRFQTMLGAHYVLEYIDVGQKNKNQDIAKRFGLDGTKGTPTVLIVDGTGAIINHDTAPTWRNAASREEGDIFEYFETFSTHEILKTDTSSEQSAGQGE